MTQVDLKGTVIASLQKILAEIEAYEVLPKPASKEAAAMGAQWDVKFDELTEKKRHAVNLTRILLPPEVGVVIDAIDKAAYYRQQDKQFQQ